MTKKAFLKNFTHFLKNSPTALHAVLEIKNQLLEKGFSFLDEEDSWNLKACGRYFCIREGSLIAFILPEFEMTKALILASHTDSPSLKLKPDAEFIKEGMILWGVEVYGAPLLNSWLNRDLGVAGKILYLDAKGEIKESLVNIQEAPCTIPQLAIHLDREVNEKGLLLNKQEHLSALASICGEKINPEYLLSLLKKKIPFKKLLAHDLFLYPLEEAVFLGKTQELLASYRLDSLASVFAILTSFLENETSSPRELQMIAFFDHEEIGSGTSVGAESPFFSHVFERITLNKKISREDHLKLVKRSLCISVDLGHSVHPNYPEKHDPQHKPKLGSGVLIKTHAQKKYATDVKSVKRVIEMATMKKIPFTIISSRNDIPSGSTIGPIHASGTGIETVDIGIGQLSMHSIRELIATDDLLSLTQLLTHVLYPAS